MDVSCVGIKENPSCNIIVRSRASFLRLPRDVCMYVCCFFFSHSVVRNELSRVRGIPGALENKQQVCNTFSSLQYFSSVTEQRCWVFLFFSVLSGLILRVLLGKKKKHFCHIRLCNNHTSSIMASLPVMILCIIMPARGGGAKVIWN